MGASIRLADGGESTLTPRDLDRLETALRGRLLTRRSPDYDAARRVWNGMIDRRPAMIAQCASPDDVASCVRYAGERGLLVSVRGGGHNIWGSAVCDDGFVIDLSPMKSVHVDPDRRTAQVAPGVTLAELDAATQREGLALPLGINSTTGVAGLTLGGGFGWLSRSLGLTIDALRSADVVLATGERARASVEDHPDLFWAIRGGGGNFGVVTRFDFDLTPVGPELLAGLIVHPLDAAGDVLRFYREFIAATPDEFVCWAVMRKAPPLPFLPAEWHGREILVLAVCHNGPVAEGERIARPLRSFGRPIADVVGPHPYTGWQQALDPLLTPGMRNYWKSHDFLELSDGLIDTLVDFAHRIPDPQTEIALAQLGGAVSRVPGDASAYAHRDAQFVMNVHGRWADPGKDDECVEWARSLYRAATPYATGGVYVNFLTEEEGDRVRAAYGRNYDSLVRMKTRFDPSNLFRVNQNIRPERAERATQIPVRPLEGAMPETMPGGMPGAMPGTMPSYPDTDTPTEQAPGAP